MSVLDLIASRNFIAVNKTLVKIFGLEEAIILGELASEYAYWQDRNELDAEGFFFSTVENIEENTALKEKRQRKAINNLQNAGIIEIKLKGLPAKRYIKISTEQLTPILLNNSGEMSETSSAKKAELDTPKRRSNKNNINKISNKNKDIYISIISHLNEKAGTAYRAAGKATQGHINARLAEGFSVDDFYSVIDKKVAEWKGSEMEKYLRPETLFGNKFENYLNAPVAPAKTYGKNGVKIKQNTEDDLVGIL